MSQIPPHLLFEQRSVEGEIRVWQQNDRRWLDFNDGLVQSEIVLNNPEILPLPLNRAMLAGVMFSEHPQRVLLAGMGGGATARYFSACFPEVSGDAVEKSEVVSQLAHDYFEFPIDNNWHIHTEDIVDYVQNCPHQYDLIIIDIAVEQKTPEWIIEQSFLKQCRSLLTDNGHLALNLLVDDGNAFMHYLSAIRTVFDCHTACLSLPNYRNTVIFSFKNNPEYDAKVLDKHLSNLEKSWGLEFGDFLQQMLKDNPENSGIL
mgnify:CR=1 FL=1